ncbi:MAG: hypothetical protein A3J83_00300 [Elusimicrobia bacterium RIFOXYA2_FULL_40_6]|nr:MAG: hypothetical protein A3J83_00300 [Elusimicrobia bacterium RIFOXYA2_FULL_40_6]
MRVSYRTKLLFAISLIGFVSLTALVLDRVFLFDDILNDRIVNRIDAIGNILVVETRNHLIKQDYKNLQIILDLTDQLPQIEFVSLLNNNGFVLYSSRKNFRNKISRFENSGNIKKEKSDIFVKSFPIMNKDEVKTIGSVQIGHSMKSLRDESKRVVSRSSQFGIIMIFLVLAASWFVSGNFLRPLVEMKVMTGKIAKGDFSARMKVSSKDIIGKLGFALNDMAGQLDDLTNNLNNKVKDATRGLEVANLSLKKANERLLELDNLKNEFVSMVSHEIRTPLTGIIGFAKTLMNLDLPEKQRKEYLEIIENEGKRLAVLTEDFLDISKIESKNMDLRLEAVDLAEVIKGTLKTFKVANDIQIQLKLTGEIPKVRADKGRIEQVLLNFLTNALRYTKNSGKIFIENKCTESSVIISVKDEGPGIAKENMDRLFEKFYRGKDNISKKTRGSGLGLAIAKGIIEAHGGKISVESDGVPGQGSTFSFSLPKQEKA